MVRFGLVELVTFQLLDQVVSLVLGIRLPVSLVCSLSSLPTNNKICDIGVYSVCFVCIFIPKYDSLFI